jgi:hypothetical protein
MEKSQVFEVVKSAFEMKVAPKQGAFGGCGRVYISVCGDRAVINAVSAAAKKLGIIFQRKAAYGMRNALYVGYDNADGRAMARGEAIAEYLKANGIVAYMDAHGD